MRSTLYRAIIGGLGACLFAPALVHAELTITSFTATPTAAIGQPIDLNVTVANQGSPGASPGSLVNLYLLDGNDFRLFYFGSFNTPPIETGQTFQFSKRFTTPATLTFIGGAERQAVSAALVSRGLMPDRVISASVGDAPSPGQYYWIAFAPSGSPALKLADHGPLMITSSPVPKLAVTAFQANPVGASFSYSFTVANQSLANAGPFRMGLKLTLPGTPAAFHTFWLDQCASTGLVAGQTFSCIGSVPSPLALLPGQYSLSLIADVNLDVVQADRSDGVASNPAQFNGAVSGPLAGQTTITTLASGLGWTEGVASDASGNFYVSQPYLHQVLKISATGDVTRFAGTGTPGFNGDNRPANTAQLSTPMGLAVDKLGNVYIADSQNGRVRMVTPGGTITTFAGSSVRGPFGASQNNVPATSAKLNVPTGLAIDAAGGLYIADKGEGVVWYVEPAQQRISKVAGSYGALPTGFDGPATSAGLASPVALAVDNDDSSFYIVESDAHRVRKVKGGVITTFAGIGTTPSNGTTARSTNLFYPSGIAVDSAGKVYLSDSGFFRVLVIARDGNIITDVGTGTPGHTGDGGPAGNANVSPRGVAIDAAGRLLIASGSSLRVVKTESGSKPAALSIVKSHTGSFIQGQGDASFTIVVKNDAAASSTTGIVTVTDDLPPGLGLLSMSGDGWNCRANVCTRTDALLAGASYPPIIVTVSVSDTASPQVVNQAGVTGGGSVAANAADPVTILQLPGSPSLKSPANGASGLEQPILLTWAAASNAATYDVYFGEVSKPWTITNTSAVSFDPGPLDSNTTYHWKVVARNPAGSSSSVIWTFTTKAVISGIEAVSGTPQSTIHGTSFAAPLKAKVTDVGGKPVPGVTVAFSAPFAGPTATFAGNAAVPAVTDASGIATSPVPVANGFDGTYTVVASVADLSTTASFVLTNIGVALPSGGSTLFAPADAPTETYNGGPVELGLRFRADVRGAIQGVRFFKPAGDTSTHTGSLWTNDGKLLATGTFTNETAAGWQQLLFNQPVVILPNTTYVVSYHTGGTYYFTANAFTNAGIDKAPLHALKDGADGPNGAYLYGAGGSFPSNANSGSNFWVDPVFVAAPPLQTIAVVSGTPQSATRGTAFGQPLKVKVTDAASNPAPAVTVTFTAPASGPSATFNGSVTATAVTDISGVAVSPLPLANNVDGPYTVSASVPGLDPASFALTNTPKIIPPGADITLFDGTETPGQYYKGSPVELGVRFRSDVNGWVKGVRFFKAGADTSAHTGSLWNNRGQLLATGTFTNESASGWQQLLFTQPVAIEANTTYIASYHTDGGFYYTWYAFQNQGIDVPPLHALKDGVDGGNGVYIYGSGGTPPTETFNQSNYWVDPVFVTSLPLQGVSVVSGTPQSATHGTAFVLPLKVKVTNTAASGVSGVTVTFTAPAVGASATFNGLVTATAVTDGSGVATSPIPTANGIDGSYTVSASVPGLTSAVFNLTNTAPVVVPPEEKYIFSTSRPNDTYNGGPVELGVRFRADVSGVIKGIRFFKPPTDTTEHTGSLWSQAGQLLATGTFTNESASGWQVLTFAQPVAISANTTYIASYHTNGPFYYSWFAFQNQGIDNPPLHALADGADGRNGVYVYGPGGAPPTETFNATNYWVDVVFLPGATIASKK